MSESSEQTTPAPKGWYPVEDGTVKRYWDGTGWTDFYDPRRGAKTRKPWRKVSSAILLIATIAAFLVGLGIGIGSGGGNSTDLEAEVATLHDQLERAQDQATTLQERSNDVALRASELDRREADLDSREEAISAEEDRIAQDTFQGDGLYVVGVDINPGRYRSDGGSNCYWARLNAAGDDIIDNYLGSGQTVVTVQPGDGLLEVSGCAPFTKF